MTMTMTMTATTSSSPGVGVGMPPGPPFALWQLYRWTRDAHAFFDESFRRYGDPFSVPFPDGSRMVNTGEPDGIREIFMADPDTFEVMEPDMLRPLVGTHSLLLLAGPRHRRERQLMSPPFHGQRMRAYGQLMQDVATRHASKWSAEPFAVHETMQNISLEVILRAVFGVQDGERVALFEKAVIDFVSAGTPAILFVKALRRDLGPWSPWGRLKRAEVPLDMLIFDEVARRSRDSQPGEDILGMLLAARHEDGSALSRQELRDELLTLLVAGHETTASALAWALYYLHRDRPLLDRLLDEMRGASQDPLQISHLPFLDAVCSETLRLNPIVADVPRKLVKPFVLRGHEIPAGNAVVAAIVTAHRNPSIYPEPERFNPDRFIGHHYSPYEFLPFGGGTRRCIGASFAVYEMKQVLHAILTRHRLRLIAGDDVKPVLRNVTWAPAGGVVMQREERQ